MKALKQFRKSIAFGYLLVILGAFLVASLLLGATFTASDYSNRMTSLASQALDRATFVSAVIPEAVYTKDFLTLETLMRQTVKDPLIVYSVILNNDGKAITRYVNRDIPQISNVLDQLDNAPSGGILGLVTLVDQAADVRSVTVPVQSEGVLLGQVKLGYSVASVRAEMVQTAGRILVIMIATSLLLAVVTVAVFRWRVGRPLLAVRDLAQSLAGGDLSQRAEVRGHDEIAQLQLAFNTMADRLQKTLTGLRLSQEQTEKLSMVAARTDNMVIISDAKGRIEWVNDAFVRVTGYTLAEVLGRSPGSILQGPETDPNVVAYMHRHLRHQQGFTCEVINYSKSGRKYWTAIEVQPVWDDDGKLTNFIALESDITERKAAERDLRQAKEEAEAANQAKSIFLANMSHELRTPLNAIIGYSEMLLEDYGLEDDPDVAQDLGRIQSAGKHLLALISDILDLSKIEAGRMEVYLEGFDADRLMADVASTVMTLIQANNNHLALDLPEENVLMLSDMTKVRQILFNLLSNAAKFTQGGTVTASVRRISQAEMVEQLHQFRSTQAAATSQETDPVEDVDGTEASFPVESSDEWFNQWLENALIPDGTSTDSADAGGTNTLLFVPDSSDSPDVQGWQANRYTDWVRFTVTDTGIGMTADQMSTVFQAFKQGDASTTRKYGGTGLGLAISHRFSQLLGGTIQVSSKFGAGTTFCVCLPQEIHLVDNEDATEETQDPRAQDLQAIINRVDIETNNRLRDKIGTDTVDD